MRRWPRSLLVVILLVFPVVLISLNYFEDIAETRGLFPPSDFDRGVAAWLVSLAATIPNHTMGLASETGYAGIFPLMLLEAAAFPLSFWLVVIYSTVATLLGSFIDYYVGLRLGLP